MTASEPVAREWEPRQINPDGDGEIFASGTDEMIPWTKLWPEHNALVARLRDVERENTALSATIAASCEEERQQLWEAHSGGCPRATTAEAQSKSLRAQRDAAVEALQRLMPFIFERDMKGESEYEQAVLAAKRGLDVALAALKEKTKP